MIRRRREYFRTGLILLATLPLLVQPLTVFASKKPHRSPLSPEEASKRFLKNAKPIPDEQWKDIAGQRWSETYTISRGDSLSEVSKRLFGDMKYWPKVWALNNKTILNPNRIVPGLVLGFSPGSVASLPTVAVNNTASSDNKASDAPTGTIKTSNGKGRSQEWKDLPRQSWETVPIAQDPSIDPQGFDRRSKIVFRSNKSFESAFIPATEKLVFLAQIIGSRSDGVYLGLGDLVFVRPDETIQVGETYAVTTTPTLVKSHESGRSGYSYPYLGRIKIEGVKADLYIGRLLSVHGFLPRGSSLVKLPPKLSVNDPIPGPGPIRASLMVDRSVSTYAAAQHKEVFIDRGTDDGVKPGMVFRAYQYLDPSNHKRITKKDFLIDAHIIVTQASEAISTGVVIDGKSIILEDSALVLLTDVTQFKKNKEFEDSPTPEEGNAEPGNTETPHTTENAPEKETNELDNLDSPDELDGDEQKSLKQLEEWKGKEGTPAPDAQPGPATAEPKPPTPSTEPTAPSADPATPSASAPAATGDTVSPDELGPEHEADSSSEPLPPLPPE